MLLADCSHELIGKDLGSLGVFALLLDFCGFFKCAPVQVQIITSIDGVEGGAEQSLSIMLNNPQGYGWRSVKIESFWLLGGACFLVVKSLYPPLAKFNLLLRPDSQKRALLCTVLAELGRQQLSTSELLPWLTGLKEVGQ